MDNELIELLEFAKSQKIDFVEYEGIRHDVKGFKFKKYYTVYDKNDFYISECDSLDKLLEFLNTQKKRIISTMIVQNNLIKNKYHVRKTYELITIEKTEQETQKEFAPLKKKTAVLQTDKNIPSIENPYGMPKWLRKFMENKPISELKFI